VVTNTLYAPDGDTPMVSTSRVTCSAEEGDSRS
jgi:hypothetical protein